MTSNREIISLLMKSSWSASDIKNYLTLTGKKCGREKAYQIRDEAIQSGGAIRFRPYEVKVNAVLDLFGKSRAEEIQLIKLTESENNHEIESTSTL